MHLQGLYVCLYLNIIYVFIVKSFFIAELQKQLNKINNFIIFTILLILSPIFISPLVVIIDET